MFGLVVMIPILLIGAIALVVALVLAAAIAPRKPVWLDDRRLFEEHNHPVERTEIPEDDFA